MLIFKKNPQTNEIKAFNDIDSIGISYVNWVDATQAEINADRLLVLKNKYIQATEQEFQFILNNGMANIRVKGKDWLCKIDNLTTIQLGLVEREIEKETPKKDKPFRNWANPYEQILIGISDINNYRNWVGRYLFTDGIDNLYSINRNIKTQISNCTTLAELETLIFTPYPKKALAIYWYPTLIEPLARKREDLLINTRFDNNAWFDIFEVGKRPIQL